MKNLASVDKVPIVNNKLKFINIDISYKFFRLICALQHTMLWVAKKKCFTHLRCIKLTWFYHFLFTDYNYMDMWLFCMSYKNILISPKNFCTEFVLLYYLLYLNLSFYLLPYFYTNTTINKQWYAFFMHKTYNTATQTSFVLSQGMKPIIQVNGSWCC